MVRATARAPTADDRRTRVFLETISEVSLQWHSTLMAGKSVDGLAIGRVDGWVGGWLAGWVGG